MSLWFLHLVLCLGLSHPKLYKYESIFSCDTRMVSFFLHLNVIPVELIVQYVCLGAGLTPSEPPSLHPPPCGHMMEWQSPVTHEGWHWRPWGRWVLGSWWFPLRDSLFPILWQRGWCGCQADVDRPGSTPNLATWQLSHWERVSPALSSSSVKWG